MTAYTGTVVGTPRYDQGKDFTEQGYYTLGGAVASGDTFTFSNILPDAPVIVKDVVVIAPELDTDASPTGTFTVGDGTDADGYIAGGLMGASGAAGQIKFHANGDLVNTTSRPSSRNIVITLGGTVATAQTAGKIRVLVTYSC